MSSQGYGKQLLEAEDLLQKHKLVASQISSLGERVRHISDRAEEIMKGQSVKSDVLKARLVMLLQQYQNLVDLCTTR